MHTKLMTQNSSLNNEVTKWVYECLASLGYTLKDTLPETVVNTPWSHVLRFATTTGYVYLKQMPENLALEAKIIQTLHDKFNARVPEIIAHNTKLSCFLMRDSGTSLRSILKQKFDAELFCKTILQFTSLQLATADQVDVFLAIGVPDWRLDKLPNLYKELLLRQDLLIEDGLSEIEIKELIALLPNVSNLCKKLATYSLKSTIVQPDFSDNNTLINITSKDLTIIDLGEIVISHPFFSLLNCLQQLKKHYGFTDTDDTYLQIKDACLTNYMTFHSKQHLLDAFTTAQLVFVIYDILSQYRLMLACGKDKIISFQHGRLSRSLREIIAF